MEFVIKTAQAPVIKRGLRHGNFRVGVRKESQFVDKVEIKNPDEIESLVINFLRSNERIEVVEGNVTRKEISDRILKRGGNLRRIIVREYQGKLYLCRAAFWKGHRLPYEFADGIDEEIRKELGASTGNKDEIKDRMWYRTPLPTEIEYEFEYAEWLEAVDRQREQVLQDELQAMLHTIEIQGVAKISKL